MKDEAKQILFDSQGALGFAALLAGGPMAAGKLAEWKHTVCDDCANVDSVHKQDGIEGCHGESVNVCKWHAGPARIYPDGPPWPGCRGFILRDGAPGPVKRAHEASQKNYDAALAAHKARQEKP